MTAWGHTNLLAKNLAHYNATTAKIVAQMTGFAYHKSKAMPV